MSTIRGSAHYAGLLPVELSDDPPPARPTPLEKHPLPQAPPRKQIWRAFAYFMMTFCIGIAATLAWQSYGNAARQMIANAYAQVGSFAPWRALTAQKAPDTIAPAAS